MGIGAFLIWSFTPFYFEAIQHLQVVEIVAHRFLWCIPFMAVVLFIGRQWTALAQAIRAPRVLATLFLTSALISVNWSMFIFSVVTDQLLAASLGYFLSPLVNVLLGFAVLRERLSNGQRVAVALATIGVGIQIIAFGQVPWIALVIAFSFGLYGLLRKTVNAGAAVGLFVECVVIAPLALGALILFEFRGTGAFGQHGLGFDGLIALSGIVTGLPLLMFAASARRVKLATIGLMQYIAPSFYLLFAVTFFPQPFGTAEIITFAFIWLALIIYTTEIWRTHIV